MDGDDRSGGSSGGFDDWLDEEPGPDTDPYAALGEDDPEGEISDWMAFTQGTSEDADESSADAEASVEESDEPSDQADPSDADAAPQEDETADAEPVYADFDEGDETGELEIVEAVAVADDVVDDDDDTGEIDVVEDEEVIEELPAEPESVEEDHFAPATTVDPFEFDGGGRPDTEELPILASADVVAASITNESSVADDTVDAADDQPELGLDDPDAVVEMEAVVIDESPDDEPIEDEVVIEDLDEPDTGEIGIGEDADQYETGAVIEVEDDSTENEAAEDDEDDTGELDVIEFPAAAAAVGAASDFGELWDSTDETDEIEVPDEATNTPFDLSQEDYLQTATKEHAGLAAAIADADDEDTEQVALAAPIPGLESTVVGFEDVVEAEGHSKARARRGGDLVARVITAIVLIAAFAASLIWQPALMALATVVFVIAAGEFYTALARTGRHPIGLFGFIGIIAATVGAFFWSAAAIPAAFVLVATLLLLYYAVAPAKKDPMSNLALTITVMAWVGLGAFAMPIAVSDEYRPLVVGVVVTVAAMDIAQYFIGRAIGRHQLAPWVSPKKTIEGLIGGIVVALAIGASLHFFPPYELTSGLALGVAVAILGPLGDLAVSAAKRSLDLKDMGSILPGHGGFLDRIDGLLFVIPAAWAIFLWAGIL